MSRPLRLEYPGSFWHITARGNNRQLIFADDDDRRSFLEMLGESVERFGWIVPAYVLMPNHYHLVLELTWPELSRGMHWLNSRFSLRFNQRHRRVGHLFQARFKSFLVDKEAYFLELLRYVVLNPVRARMTSRPDDYEWSSHRAVLGEVAAPEWLAVDDALAPFGRNRDAARSEYRAFVDRAIGCDARLWDAVVGQVYLGRSEWIDEIRERIAVKPRSKEH
ncbi:MAG TPA: transposase, partial [Vicinamibacterales bacterium]|nr:transposase [Vicinamibacterales bacterium]